MNIKRILLIVFAVLIIIGSLGVMIRFSVPATKKPQNNNDDSLIADYAKDSVYALKENGIINGYENSFNPVNNLTRAEASKVISELLGIL